MRFFKHPARELRDLTREFRRSAQIIAQLFRMTGREVRYSLMALQGFNIVNGVANLLSTLSVVPFLAMVITPDRVENNRWVKGLKNLLGIETQEGLIVAMGVLSFSVLCASHAVNFVLSLYQLRLQNHLTLTIYDRMTKHYFSHDYEFHLQSHSAVLLQNMMNRAKDVITTLLQTTFKLLENIIYIALGVAVIYAANPYLTLPVMLFLFASVLLVIYRSRSHAKEAERMSLAQSAIGQTVSLDTLRNMESIQVSGRWRYFSDRMWETRRIQMKMQEKLHVVRALAKPLMELPLAGIVVGSIIVTVLTFGDSLRVLVSLAVFGLVSYRIVPRVTALLPMYMNIQRGIVNFDFMGEDLILAYQRTFPPRPTQRMPFKKSLRLEDLRYAYPNAGKNALEGISLEIPQGTSIGVCGNTGSGKSTLVKLILRLLKPKSGRILVDGEELDEENTPTWQNLIGYVSQSNTLLSLDFTENIALGIPSEQIDHERIEQALKDAELHDFVSSLPNGANSMIGEQGQQLSGGQGQRLAIARALYNDPELLIFDEATSALDNITERAVMNTIYHLSDRNRTLFIVAHRLSTLQRCDTLVMMENGKIVAQGSYRELLKSSEKFSKLAALDAEEEEDKEKDELKTRELVAETQASAHQEAEALARQEADSGARS